MPSFFLFLLTLWDYYLPSYGGRVFDYFALVSILISVVVALYAGERLAYPKWLLFVFSLSVVQVIYGALNRNELAAMAFLAGFILILPYFFTNGFASGKGVNSKYLDLIIGFHVLMFFVQYFVFHVFSYPIDFHGTVGSIDARTFNEVTGYFRAAGLFQEPNSYCVTIYALLILKLIISDGRVDLLGLVAWFSLFASESLWGGGAGVVVAILFFNSNLIRYSVVVLLATSFFVFVNAPELFNYILDPITVTRMLDLDLDPSRHARYGLTENINLNFHFFLGSGINTSDFQSFFGANGYSFAIYSFGLLWTIGFLMAIYFNSSAHRLKVVVAVLFAMTTYPLFTYLFWYAWLALMVRGRDHEPALP
jgi:hypothetical protein